MRPPEVPEQFPTGAGPKTTLMQLHGGGPGVDAGTNWLSVSDRLAETFACVAPDLLGFGSALSLPNGIALPHGPVAWARARAQQIVDLMDEHDLEQVAVLGNSAAGGAAALALMATVPGRVSRAVVMGGAGTGGLPATVPFYDDRSRDSMLATLANLVADPKAHEELLDRLADLRLEQALRPGAEEAFRAMFEPVDAPEPIDLSVVTCPVLALHGELDRVSPVAVSERLVERLPNARLEVVAGAGHWIHVDRPDEFCLLVEEFLHA
ncbi:MAG: alpha/beta hydrolase [Nocardioides sp.]|nr:alpha/beta hydrolase [Nocardioides sp.]